MLDVNFKIKLTIHLKKGLLDKIALLEDQKKQAAIAQQSDTKSSAGDKFETGREMVQAEMNKLDNQRYNLQEALKTIEQITTTSPQEVSFGSLVICSNAIYFIALGLGRINFKGHDIFVISLASPIGKQLHKLKKNDNLKINGQAIEIEEII